MENRQFWSEFSSNISLTSNETFAHDHIIEDHMENRQFLREFSSNISLTSNETFVHDHIIEYHMENRQFWKEFSSNISIKCCFLDQLMIIWHSRIDQEING
jgi:methionine-rich copper-binding protein CopC